MKMNLKKSSQPNASTLVIFAARDKKSSKAVYGKLDSSWADLIQTGQADGAFGGDQRESLFFRNCNASNCKNILLVGLGDSSKLTPESFRVAGAVAYGALKNHKITSAAFHGDSFLKFAKNNEAVIEALVQGVELAAYEYNELKTKGKKPKNSDQKSGKKTDGKSAEDDKPTLDEISILLNNAPSSTLQKALQRAEVLTECQNFARWLGDTPGNIMTPSRLADETVEAAKGTGLKVTVWDKARIKKENFGGLYSVSLGSSEEPRFIIMEYKGGGAGKKPIAFVGKGLTFDSGGISIKPSAAMEEMKYDMCGGAAVIATMLAIARLKLKVNAVGFVPSTENMPGPSALKPGDVYFARNGKSVEVFNTDAEGRLILGDALAYASEQKPAAIFDTATLTGAILISLGNTHTGVFTRDQKVMRKIQEASDQSGELVWQLPLVDAHLDDMKGTHADLCNISGGRLAGSSTAAAFLGEFVDPEIPWAHFDIAGTAWNVASRLPYCPKKSASGVIMRTFVSLVEKF